MLSVGERIKQARLAAGLSGRQLAARVGVSHMAISKYEKNQMRPSTEVLLRLADALGIKVGFFSRPLQVELCCPAYRKHRRLPKRAQERIEGQIKEFLERYLTVEELFAPEERPPFAWPFECSGRLRCVEEVEDWAEALRQAWGIGDDPIASLCETLEDHGVKVLLLEEGEEHFDGYSCWANESVPVVACPKEGRPGDRQRFTLAHELGHLLLADHLAAAVDPERACYRFAGAFLVPAAAVRHEVGAFRRRIELEELYDLKHKWGLSMRAWLFRLRDLGIISASYYQRMERQFRACGWHLREPGVQVPAEQPTRFKRLVERAVAEDLISLARAADLLNQPLIAVRQKMSWPAAQEVAL
ncbi:MAG: XRE family transcriptional regulator [Candidatus Methanomethyliaceae archaeon]